GAGPVGRRGIVGSVQEDYPIYMTAKLIGGAALRLICAAAAKPAGTGETLPGPVPADVVRVIDGDTLKVRAHIWIGQAVETAVRLQGINAPELRGDCEAERRLAAAARDYLARLVAGGKVRLRDIAQDKYGGRVVARIDDPSGRDIGAALVAAGLARPYDGGKRHKWC